jgi:hypothetical protein
MANESNRITTNEELASKIKEIENFIKERAESKKAMIKFPSNFIETTDADIPANIIIAEAFNQLKDAIVAGIDHDGNWWFSLSMGDGPHAMWIMEHFKQTLMEQAPAQDYNEGREI